MTKKKRRENLYIMLFLAQFYPEAEWEAQIDLFLADKEEEKISESEKNELKTRFFAVTSHEEKIDQKIEEKSQGWSITRLAKSDLTILRLAIFEILFDDDVPNRVAINEAVELAKSYGTEKSYRFVNGVLGSVVRELSDTEGTETEET